jgi:hypothetical protein
LRPLRGAALASATEPSATAPVEEVQLQDSLACSECCGLHRLEHSPLFVVPPVNL